MSVFRSAIIFSAAVLCPNGVEIQMTLVGVDRICVNVNFVVIFMVIFRCDWLNHSNCVLP